MTAAADEQLQELRARLAAVEDLAGFYEVLEARVRALEQAPQGDSISLATTGGGISKAEAEAIANAAAAAAVAGRITKAEAEAIANAAAAAAVAAVAPSAWTALTLPEAVESGAGGALGVRKEDQNSKASLRGTVKIKVAKEVKEGNTILTVPVGFRPLAQVRYLEGVVGVGTIALTITAAGVMTGNITLAAGNELPLDGVNFNLT